jgi:hypothetical protein
MSGVVAEFHCVFLGSSAADVSHAVLEQWVRLSNTCHMEDRRSSGRGVPKPRPGKGTPSFLI